MEAPFEEPGGYAAIPGFVKSQSGNNDYYLAQYEDDPWYPALIECHMNIREVVPNYNISQIKAKFGGLRYYISLPPEEEIDWSRVPSQVASRDDRMSALYEWCDRRVSRAEAWVDGYEAARRELSDS